MIWWEIETSDSGCVTIARNIKVGYLIQYEALDMLARDAVETALQEFKWTISPEEYQEYSELLGQIELLYEQWSFLLD